MQITEGDILSTALEDSIQDENAKSVKLRGADQDNNGFFQAISELIANRVTTHEQTKSNSYYHSSKTTERQFPIVFLAARLNRKNSFQGLINVFDSDNQDIHQLVDDKYNANILHHIYGPNSTADEDMITNVFKWLEKYCTNETILKMINSKDKDNQTVLDYAIARDKSSVRETLFQKNLKLKIATYSAMPVAFADMNPGVSAAAAGPVVDMGTPISDDDDDLQYTPALSPDSPALSPDAVASDYRARLSFFAQGFKMDPQSWRLLNKEENDALDILSRCNPQA